MQQESKSEKKEQIQEQLDITWIQEFEKNDKLYHHFYSDDNYYINTFFIYLNKKHEIEKIREEVFIMKDPNVISREEILGLVQRNSFEEKRKFTILSLLKFNLSLEPEQMKEFLQDTENKTNQFLKPVQHIDTITFTKTIHMFQDLNSLYFLFLEKSSDDDLNIHTKRNLTKKMYSYLKNSIHLDNVPSSTNIHTKNTQIKTKKHKKTIRKL